MVDQKGGHLEEEVHTCPGHREGNHLGQVVGVLQEDPYEAHLEVLLALVYKEDILDSLLVQVVPDSHILDIHLEVEEDSCQVGDHILQMGVHNL